MSTRMGRAATVAASTRAVGQNTKRGMVATKETAAQRGAAQSNRVLRVVWWRRGRCCVAVLVMLRAKAAAGGSLGGVAAS